jgi:hypothetical protein
VNQRRVRIARETTARQRIQPEAFQTKQSAKGINQRHVGTEICQRSKLEADVMMERVLVEKLEVFDVRRLGEPACAQELPGTTEDQVAHCDFPTATIFTITTRN